MTYVPGIKQRIPWPDLPDDPTFRPDTLVAGGIYMRGHGPQLLTPLDGG